MQKNLLVITADDAFSIFVMDSVDPLEMTVVPARSRELATRLLPPAGTAGVVAGIVLDLTAARDPCERTRFVTAFRETYPESFLSAVFDRLPPEQETAAYDAGADHCFCAPLSAEVLRAKIRSLILRFAPFRETAEEKHIRRVAGLQIDVSRRSASLRSAELPLTPAEFTILEVLSRSPGKATSLETLGTTLWGMDADYYFTHLKCHISRLRRKMSCGDPTLEIRSVRGVGYALDIKNERPNLRRN